MTYVKTLAILTPEPNSKWWIVSLLKQQGSMTNVFKNPKHHKYSEPMSVALT